ncbi:MAG: CocE/NonD family hydrolase [Candidatus Lokiarchaeota archaeon]|nr:CocE/NonD family hydrolase [Candidatus Lokiarchaeota archaeon]
MEATSARRMPFAFDPGGRLEAMYADYTTRAVYVPVRDGTRLAVEVLVPDGAAGEKFPAVLIQERYWRAMRLRIPFRWFFRRIPMVDKLVHLVCDRGIAVVFLDDRGTGASFGTKDYPFAPAEVEDTADVIDWIVRQPWCDGDVAAFGSSYTGTMAELSASRGHPALKGVFAMHCSWDLYASIGFPGGLWNTGFQRPWSILTRYLDKNSVLGYVKLRHLLPAIFLQGVKPVDEDLRGALLKQAVKEHEQNHYVIETSEGITFRDDPLDDVGMTVDRISVFAYKDRIEGSGVPFYCWSSWFDAGYGQAAIDRFLTFSNPQRAVIGDWNHGALLRANPFFPKDRKVRIPQSEQAVEWINFFDRAIRGEVPREKVLWYYTMGEERWKRTATWPPEGTAMQRWFPCANHGLLTNPDEAEDGARDVYEVDFSATSGRNNRWWSPIGVAIDYRSRKEQDRRLLVYDSPRLVSDCVITGNPVVKLSMSSTHEDGAVIAYLEIVQPNGYVVYLTEGNLRLMHRKVSKSPPPYVQSMPYHSFNREDAMPMKPGAVEEVSFGMLAVSARARKGDRIRLAIAGADKDSFPRYPAEGTPRIEVRRSGTMCSFLDIPVSPT